jgi:hypothetical protein
MTASEQIDGPPLHSEFPENYNDAGSRTGVPCLGGVEPWLKIL